MNIAVVALGKIGLPLAVQFALKGHDVVGVDINAAVVDDVNAAREPFPGEDRLPEYLRRVVGSGRLRATTDFSEAIPCADTVVVVVPLFVDGNGQPDFGWMDTATNSIAKHLSPDSLVIYETTLPVGTTRTRWKPALELGSGLREGTDFHVAFSPERVLTGRVFADLRKYPKLIGALSGQGARRVADFYNSVLDFDPRPDLERGNGVWDLGSPEAAEMAKLAETTYRDVNIGLANQFAKFAEEVGINVFEVIEASNSQPYSHIHRPGISVGGHCIPVYPRLYLFNDPDATVVRAAREANAGMPQQVVQRLVQDAGGLASLRVAVLGASYRPGVKETAFSGVFDVVKHLTQAGAHVTVHDPLYSDDELRTMGLQPHALGSPVDVVILHTDHAEYRDLEPADLGNPGHVVDGRGMFNQDFVGTRLQRLGVGKQSKGPDEVTT